MRARKAHLCAMGTCAWMCVCAYSAAAASVHGAAVLAGLAHSIPSPHGSWPEPPHAPQLLPSATSLGASTSTARLHAHTYPTLLPSRSRACVRACVRAHPSAASDRRTPSTSDDCSASASRLLWWRPSATPTLERVCCCTRVRGGDEYADAVAGDAVAGVSVSLSDERAEPPLVGEADEPAKPSEAKHSPAKPSQAIRGKQL